MKPLGPYVAARDLPGRMNSPVRTLRATDRLTGMPVLLHALPAPQALPALPEQPNVLRPSDCVVMGAEAFMVTELPLQARPAQDPELTARGALAALAALHERGMTHGGLSASQLWSVDGEVRLAGAGLPWGGDPRPQDDLYALAVILHEMGGIPDVLRPLLETPGRLDARAALRLLPALPHAEAALSADAPVTPVAAQRPVASSPAPASLAPASPALASSVPTHPEPPASPEAAPAGPAGRPEGAGAPADRPGRRGRRFRLPGSAPAPEASSTPVVTVQTGPETADPVMVFPVPVPAPAAAAPAAAEADSAPAPVEPRPAHDGTLIVLGEPDDTSPEQPSPAAVGTASADPARHSPAPASAEPQQDDTAPQTALTTAPEPAPDTPPSPQFGGKLSPQERRRLEHEARREQAGRDAQAAAERRLRRLDPDATAPAAAPRPAPTLIQIGFDDDLPAWEADPPAAPPRIQVREVPRLPESLRRPAMSVEPGTGPETTAETAPDDRPGALPARRRVGEPIRIGWDEDDSWRIVREAPSAPLRPRRPLPLRLLFWTGLAVGFVVMALLLTSLLRRPAAQAAGAPQAATTRVPGQEGTTAQAGTAATAGSAPTEPATGNATPLQPVQFTVRGVAGATARLSVEQAPNGANLAPGASLGTAPGRVRFPVAGTYRVRVAVDGFAPGSMTVTVPRTQPVTIDLDN